MKSVGCITHRCPGSHPALYESAQWAVGCETGKFDAMLGSSRSWLLLLCSSQHGITVSGWSNVCTSSYVLWPVLCVAIQRCVVALRSCALQTGKLHTMRAGKQLKHYTCLFGYLQTKGMTSLVVLPKVPLTRRLIFLLNPI